MSEKRLTLKQLEARLAKVEQEYGKLMDKEAYYDNLMQYDDEDQVLPFEEIKRNIAAIPKARYHLLTGFSGLDAIIEGFRPGNLVTISAPTKQGKTTLAQSFTRGFSEQGHKSLWFSFEVPMAEFLHHYGDNIPNGYAPAAFPKATTQRLEWVRWRVEEAIAKYDVRAVFIDHLHFLMGMQDLAMGNTSIMVGGIMRELKRMAVALDVTVFLIAHVKKSLNNSKPNLEDLRDSSFIAQESDIVLMMWRKLNRLSHDFSDKADVAVRAHRRTGKVGIVTVEHINGLFYEPGSTPNEAPGEKQSAVGSLIQKGVSAVTKRSDEDEGYPEWGDE